MKPNIKYTANKPSNIVVLDIFRCMYDCVLSLSVIVLILNLGVLMKADFLPISPWITAIELCNDKPMERERNMGNRKINLAIILSLDSLGHALPTLAT